MGYIDIHFWLALPCIRIHKNFEDEFTPRLHLPNLHVHCFDSPCGQFLPQRKSLRIPFCTVHFVGFGNFSSD